MSTILSLIGGLMIFCAFLIYTRLFITGNNSDENL